MAIDPNKAVGAVIAGGEASWNRDQVILYHLGIGAGNPPTDARELSYTYEKDLRVIPSFGVIPVFSSLAGIAAVPGLAVVTKGYEALTYQLVVEINHRRKDLADLKVRQAIAHAIDRDFVVKTIFLGYAATATGPVPKNAPEFYTGDVPTYDFSVDKANALLDEAGHPRGANGVRFQLRLLPAPWFDQTRQFGDYLRQALRAVGIDAVIVNNDPAAHLKAVYTDHAFDLAIGSPVYRNDPAISTTILYQGGLPPGVPFANQFGYNNPAMNDLIASAATELDEGARARKYYAFQKLAEADQPLIMVAEFTFTTVARDGLHNVANNPRWATSHWADAWLAG